jgi:hypothetical protein
MGSAHAYVDGTDFARARDNPHNILNPAAIDNSFDFNRDTYVDGSDLVIIRDNNTNIVTDLNLITAFPPAAPPSSNPGAPPTFPTDPYLDGIDPTAAYPLDPVLDDAGAWELPSDNTLLAEALWMVDLEQATERPESENERAVDAIFATGVDVYSDE